MGILCIRGHQHIDSHKVETMAAKIENINNKDIFPKVYVPKLSANGKEIIFTVKEGDEVKVGQQIGSQQGPFYVPVFASVSGHIIGQETRLNSLVGRPIEHFVIENDGKYTHAQPLPTLDVEKATKEEIVAAIKVAGIVGLGGAGFPTYVKYDKCHDIDTLIINGVECEPYLATDYHGGLEYPDLLIKGIKFLLKASGAKVCIVAIKKGKPKLKAKLQEVLANVEHCELYETKDVYPMGWEKTLIYEITKREYTNLPGEAGVVLNNLFTAIAVGDALSNGNPIVERLLTIAGDAIKRVAIVKVPVFAAVADIINYVGGYTKENVTLLAGGPMVAKSQMNDQFVIERQSGGLTVLQYVEYQEEPCLRCGQCTLHCPASLQPVEIKDAVNKKDNARLRALNASSCVECGSCSYVCPSHIDVTEFAKKAKLFLRIEDAKAAASNPKK